MRLKSFAAAVLILLACFYAAAETFSLDECIERSLKESEKIKAMQESEEAAKSGKDGTVFSFLPTATLDVALNWMPKYNPEGYTAGVDTTTGQPITQPFPEKSRTLGITVVQPITPLWSVSYGYKSLETAEDVAKIQRELSEDQLKLEVMNLFYNYQLLNESMEILNETKEQLQKYYEQAKNFFDAGVVDKRSVLKIEIEMAKLEQQMQTVKGNTNLIKKNMAILLDCNTLDYDKKTVASRKHYRAENKEKIDYQPGNKSPFWKLSNNSGKEHTYNEIKDLYGEISEHRDL